MVFLNPIADISFKKLFGSQEHTNILISFLNSILQRAEGHKIISVTINDTSNLPEGDNLKFSIVDIFCTDQANKKYIVEMQVVNRKDFIQRAHYYSSTAYARQLEKGCDYDKLVPVFFIGVVNFDLFKNPRYITHHLIVDVDTMEQTFPFQEFHFVELKKFNKSLELCETDVDKWIYLLKNAGSLDEIPAKLTASKDMKDAFTVLERGAWSVTELNKYQDFFDASIREKMVLETAKDEGEKKGIFKGKTEKAYEIARKMLAKNKSIEEIVEFTELTAEEVETLKIQNKISI